MFNSAKLKLIKVISLASSYVLSAGIWGYIASLFSLLGMTVEVQCYFILFFCFLGLHLRHMEVPSPGAQLELRLLAGHNHSHRHSHIRSMSAIYTAHGKAGSSTHWVRPGIEPATSWFLVGFVSSVPWSELLQCYSDS